MPFRVRRQALRPLIAAALLAFLALIVLGHAGSDNAASAQDTEQEAQSAAAPALTLADKKPDKGNKPGKGKKKPKPNVVVILTDDQATRTISPETMPNLENKILDGGTYFRDYVVTTPLCCPSRATSITGQYGHNNGVLRNDYADLKQKQNVLPAWLQHAGYRTAHIGKYLHHYRDPDGIERKPAPGWDLWFTQQEPRRYYDWRASDNGRIRHYGLENEDHVTSVTNDYAERYAGRLAKQKRPFYLQVDYFAPHTSSGRDESCRGAAVPEPQDEGRFADVEVPKPPSYDEADVSDKPQSVQERPRIDAEAEAKIERRYRCTLEAVYGIDRGIGKIYNQVKRAGELNQTVFVFSSDNGLFYGEHRIVKGKPLPYEENVKMPLAISVPKKYRRGIEQPAKSNGATANIDLAPTILDLARAEPCRSRNVCRTMDGRSLMPLIKGKKRRWPDPRGIVIERSSCQYRGLRRAKETYVQYSRRQGFDGPCERTDVEHYDLEKDPFQLNNLFKGPGGSDLNRRQRKLRRVMIKLETCAGIRGRDERPASGHFCQ